MQTASGSCRFEPSCALVAVPHREDERFGEQTHVIGLQHLLARCPTLKRLVVLSTTGVYHQHDGGWVDEQSPTQPARIGPQIALAAEQWLQHNCQSTGDEPATSWHLWTGPRAVIGQAARSEPVPVGEAR